MDKLKILVVDDESRMRKLVKDFLVKRNFEVLEAENGADAIDVFFSKKDIALVILDVMMPKMDGWQVCREIRQYSKVPIIMLTARSDERDELLGFELGVDEYISKPFSPKILVARVEAILRRTNTLAAEEILKAGGKFVSYKSVSVDEEIAQSKKAVYVLGGEIGKVEKFHLPGSDMERALVVVEKKRSTPKKYPRKAGMPTKEPLA